MEKPLIWNSLDVAVTWLSQATGKTWSVGMVLDPEIQRMKSTANNDFHLRSTIEAVMPRGTSFGLYKIEKGRHVREGDAGWSGPVPLALAHLYELLLHGATRVGLVRSPDDYEEREFIFIDPLDDEHIADIKMTGIRGDNLKSLLEFVESKKLHAVTKIETPVSTRERNTLITIIAALAKEAKIDVSKPSKAAESIADMTQRLGAPVAKRTIEEKLKLIDDALESRAKS